MRCWATRSARPLRSTARPRVRTPMRKYAMGSAKPASASRTPGTARVTTSATIATMPVTPGGSASSPQSPMASTITARTRWPSAARPAGTGMARTASPASTEATRQNPGERVIPSSAGLAQRAPGAHLPDDAALNGERDHDRQRERGQATQGHHAHGQDEAERGEAPHGLKESAQQSHGHRAPLLGV